MRMAPCGERGMWSARAKSFTVPKGMKPKADSLPTGAMPLITSLMVPSPPMQITSRPSSAAALANCVASPAFSVSLMVMSSKRLAKVLCSSGIYRGARSRPEVGFTMTVHCFSGFMYFTLRMRKSFSD